MKYLLDTCVISELVARQPNPIVVQWIDALDEEKLYLSVITIGEVAKGVQKLPDSNRRDTLSRWLQEDLLLRFQDRILPIDTNIMLVWGELAATLEKQGNPMPAIDSLIAAIALQGKLTLVTRNEQNFEHSGVVIVNPWKG